MFIVVIILGVGDSEVLVRVRGAGGKYTLVGALSDCRRIVGVGARLSPVLIGGVGLGLGTLELGSDMGTRVRWWEADGKRKWEG
jgi:hypothetical protein